MAKSERYRNFATIVYPDSAPERWVETLSDTHIPAFISPLHCDDVNATGEVKKPHYHVMIMFEGVKTRDQAREIFDSIGGVGCEIIKTIRGMARYLCHLDNPEKAQYSIEEVRQLGGADYRATIELTCDRRQSLKEILFYLQTADVRSLAELTDYALLCNENWFVCITENYAYFLDKYIKSKCWKERN